MRRFTPFYWLSGLAVLSLWLFMFLHSPARGAAQDAVVPSAPAGSAFSYQGTLSKDGLPADGLFDFLFTLYDAGSGGNQVGDTVRRDGVAVTDGLFFTSLDFGPAAFNGDGRWLEVQVSPSSGGAYQLLSPRQRLMATPMALWSQAPWRSSGGNLSYENGYVGIGLATPLWPLHLSAPQAVVRLDTTSSSFGSVLELRHTNPPGGANLGAVNFSNAGAVPGQLRYQLNDGLILKSGDSDRVWVATNGNVGLGTDTPGQSLHIVDDQAVARLDSGASANGSVLELRNTTNVVTQLGAINFNDAAATFPGQIAYAANDNMLFRVDGLERFRISGAGNVGIGNNNPQYPLHILSPQAVAQLESSSANSGSVLVLRNNSSATADLLGAINFNDAANATPGQISYRTDGALVFRAGNAERMRLDSNGITIPATQRWLAVPPASFTPEGDWVEYRLEPHRLRYILCSSVPSCPAAAFYAPLDLPHGAVIKEVKLVAFDDYGADMELRLLRTDQSSVDLSWELATVSSSGAAYSIRSFSTTTIGTPVVNNATGSYYLLLLLPYQNNPPEIWFRSAHVRYEITSPLP